MFTKQLPKSVGRQNDLSKYSMWYAYCIFFPSVCRIWEKTKLSSLSQANPKPAIMYLLGPSEMQYADKN
jgi:hypothetical protein